jgi:hypothetical protein
MQLRQGNWNPTPEDTPHSRLGGSEGVRALAEAFYDAMDATEPALAALHERDDQGKVSRAMRDRFALRCSSSAGWAARRTTPRRTATRGCACGMRACR